MIALLLVSSHRKDMSDKDGNNESITFGIVSPIITQKATMPPKALYYVNTDTLDSMKFTYKSHCARDIATRPDLPKQCCTVAWNESVPLSFEFMTMRRIVQSTTMVRPISKAVPVRRPALRTAYG